MRDVANQLLLRTECFQKLLKTELPLCKYLNELHGTLQGRVVSQELRIELVLPLLIQTEDQRAEPLETKAFGTIYIDVQKRCLTWFYDDKMFHNVDFGWSKEPKALVLVQN